MTGRDLWRSRVATTPDRTFLLWADRLWTYGAFDEEVLRFAGGLARIGVDQGTRVALGLTNRPEAYLAQLALQELGAVAVPLLAGLTRSELEYPLVHSESTALIADGPVADALLPGVAERLLLVLCDGIEPPAGARAERFEDLAAGEPVAPERHTADNRSLSLVLYTSGSTGRPKGVMIGAGTLASVGRGFSERYGIVADDNWLQPTPVAHAIGALTGLGIAVHTGCALTLVDRFSPRAFWGQVDRYGATALVLYPAQVNLLLEADDGSVVAGETTLRLVITHAYFPRFPERFGLPLATVWGMTETGAICTGSEPGYAGELGENYVGTPMVGSEIGVFGEGFERLPAGEAGEIALRHADVMLGYLKDPEATARTLVDGWVRSGDRGVIDEQGGAFFAGRFKNVIKRSGENVSAEEVEIALSACEGVSECTVFGVPDPIRAEEVAAVAVVRPGATIDPVALRAACARTLVRWKLPRYVTLVDEPLPRLLNGKVDRVRLIAAFDAATAWDAERV